MVMIALDHTVIVDINGKFGGVNYRRDACGLHMQQNPKRTKPATAAEKYQRKIFYEVLQYYGSDGRKLTTADYNAWKNYAAAHPRKNKKGETVHNTARNAFMSINIQRMIENKPIIKNPDDMTTDPPLPRLLPPYMTHSYPSPTILDITLHFPAAMETDLYFTPPLENFKLHHYYDSNPRFFYSTWRPYEYYWDDENTLVLLFKVGLSATWNCFIYTKTGAGLRTADDARESGSFRLEHEN